MERINHVQEVWIIRYPDGRMISCQNKEEAKRKVKEYELRTGMKAVIC